MKGNKDSIKLASKVYYNNPIKHTGLKNLLLDFAQTSQLYQRIGQQKHEKTHRHIIATTRKRPGMTKQITKGQRNYD